MSGLLERYHALVAAGELRPDAEQAAAAERLAQLQLELEAPPAAAGIGCWDASRRRVRAGSTCGAGLAAASRC